MKSVKIFFMTGFMGVTFVLYAQKYSSEKSLVTFFSDAPMEDIFARNEKALGIIDLSSGQVAFSIPNNGFEFEKKLMQEHFNEKYMESEKYPKSTFQAKLSGFDSQKKGVQTVTATGKLSIHGVMKEVTIPGSIEITPDNKVKINSTFMVKVADYKIKIPQVVFYNIAEEVEVKVDFIMVAK